MEISFPKFLRKKFLIYAAVSLVSLALTPFGFPFTTTHLALNQFGVQKNELLYGTASIKLISQAILSWYSLGLTLIGSSLKASDSFDFKNPDSVFTYVWKKLPSYAIVYPTDAYYYFKFSEGNETVSGNLRLVDADQGNIHFGYFHTNDPHGEGGYKLFTKNDGVRVHESTPYRFRVHYNGKTITFVLSDFFTRKPEKLTLLPDEGFVAHIWDESGIKFFLLYNNATKSFYYVLDEESGVADQLNRGQDHYLIGERTGYVFYEDQDYTRKILVGVSWQNIFDNNYFDGPFDQLPPRLPIKEKVLAAYPYTAYAGGIDEHGNFYGFKGTRIAISAYYNYRLFDELYTYLTPCNIETNKGKFWSCLTYETKKDFHKTLEAEHYPKEASGTHAIYQSQGWPANHDGSVSLTWPASHTADKSRIFPPSYRFFQSQP